MRGQVVGALGQAVEGISVALQPLSTGNVFTATYPTTDARGRFQVRLARMSGSPPPGGAPDTLSVYVFARDLRSVGVGVPAVVRDSVLTVVSVAPVGAVPVPAEVRITLPVS